MGDALDTPRARDGRAPDVFRKGAWVPMRCFEDHEEVDFAIVGTGAGGGTLAYTLATAGFRVVAFDAGPFWHPLEDFASDEQEQQKLYWTDERITGGNDPIELGSNNSGKGVGGSTVHFTMVTLRARPDWFRCRTQLGYGVDWPVDPQEARGSTGDGAVLPRGGRDAAGRGVGVLPVGSGAAAVSPAAARPERAGGCPGARLRAHGDGAAL